MRKTLELEGRVFSRLTVVEKDTIRSKDRKVKWFCKCDCGVIVSVTSGNLKSGNTKSCGCLNKEATTSHGLYKHPLYNVWSNMKKRCNNIKNPYYADYGGRGITICNRWLESISNFIEDMGEGYQLGLELDRIDNDGNYEPSNCRWVTSAQNSMNTRSRKNSSSKYKGVSWYTKIGKWAAQIEKNSEVHRLGYFTCEEEAALVYNEKALQLFGEYTYLNKVN